jgi:hypothetical protein
MPVVTETVADPLLTLKPNRNSGDTILVECPPALSQGNWGQSVVAAHRGCCAAAPVTNRVSNSIGER